jgi:hypothetical protein
MMTVYPVTACRQVREAAADDHLPVSETDMAQNIMIGRAFGVTFEASSDTQPAG